MDLGCLIDNKEEAVHASDLVAMIGDLLERGQFPSFCPFHTARQDIQNISNSLRNPARNMDKAANLEHSV